MVFEIVCLVYKEFVKIYPNMINKNQAGIKIVDSWLPKLIEHKDIASVSIGIIKDGEIIFQNSYGYADKENKIKATSKTLYKIASISKTFTASAVMLLHSQGKLSLDDKIAKYLPWLINTNKTLKDVTIRHILSHGAGIRRDGKLHFWELDKFPEKDEFIDIELKDLAVIEAKTALKYSNIGYAILGSLIEEIAGKSYQQYIQENIFNYLNLKNIFTDYDKSLDKNLAIGYGPKFPGYKREVMIHTKTNALSSAAGFISDVETLCQYIISQFYKQKSKNKSLLTNTLKREMHYPQTLFKGDNDSFYGLGFDIKKRKGSFIVGHSGGFPGFYTNIKFDPEKGDGVVVLTNTQEISASIIANSIFDIMDWVDSNVNLVKNDYSKFEGFFVSRWLRMQVLDLSGTLMLFDPYSENPVNEFMHKLLPIKAYKDEFIIDIKEGYMAPKEKVTFEFDKSSKVKMINYAENPAWIYEEYVQRLSKI
jgi:D-alanyl-D-alanine carboxypeptidase